MSSKLDQESTSLKLRRQAEACLRERKYRAGVKEAVDELDLRRLQHELEVHQVELEMQNEALQQAHAATEQALSRSTELFDFAPTGYFNLASDGSILAVNLAGAQLAGVDRSQLLNSPFVNLVLPSDRDNFTTLLVRTLAGVGRASGEVAFLSRKTAPIQVQIETLLAADGRQVGVTVFDITERKRAEQERNTLHEQLAQSRKMELVGQLAGGVAHDFNNMLGVISGQAELAIGQCDPSHPLYNSLTEILEAAGRSAKLTRQLLTFARKQVITPKILDLNEAVSGFLMMLQRLVGEAIQLDWRPGKNLWLTKMDSSQVDQILLNLCLNAQDALGGAGEIRIETGNRTLDDAHGAGHADCVPGHYVMLSVSDDGCGMDQDTMSHVFDPFFTTKKLGQGTGLGLATVYGAVKQNHGHIGVESALGKGTTFTLYLPRYDGPVGLSVPEVEVKAPTPGAETLLLVEDEPALLQLTRIMLEKLGYMVLPASSPAQALRCARENSGQIQLLVTDVVMPDMNGRELARQLQLLDPNLQCLYMSGYTDEVITQNGVLPEGVFFIQKPFTIGDLATKIREVLGNH